MWGIGLLIRETVMMWGIGLLIRETVTMWGIGGLLIREQNWEPGGLGRLL